MHRERCISALVLLCTSAPSCIWCLASAVDKFITRLWGLQTFCPAWFPAILFFCPATVLWIWQTLDRTSHLEPCSTLQTGTFGVFMEGCFCWRDILNCSWFFVNISFLVAFMSSRPLVWSYISMTNLLIIDPLFSLMLCVVLNSSNASIPGWIQTLCHAQ